MLTRNLQQFLLIINYVVVLFIFSACSESSYNDDAYQYNPAWVTITVPSSNPFTTDEEFVHLTGGAFISDGWSRCCSGSPTDTGVTVTWKNTTTGTSGYATQYIQYGSFLGYPYIKSHSWSANVPINISNNSIYITAFDPDNSKTKSITVIRVNDLTPPAIDSTYPTDQATDVAVNTPIIINFSEEIDSTSINTNSFQLYDNNNTVNGSVTYENKIATFTPNNDLSYNKFYSVTVSTEVQDLFANALVEDYNWSFTTGSVPDLTPPVVTAVQPTDSMQDVALNQAISATFDEAMDASSININSFSLKNLNSTNSVSGWIIYDDLNKKATFTPYNNFAFGTSYQATITNAVTDVSSNALVSDYIWSFTSIYDGIGTWSETSTVNAPTIRWLHTAVWAGEEMIIWGGYQEPGIYDPKNDSWKLSSVVDIRRKHTAIWTGTEMIIWGGEDINGSLNTGLKYFPKTDTSLPISLVNVPLPKIGHSDVWTGIEMIIWGGEINTSIDLNTGDRYNPTTDSWHPVSTVGAPEGRYLHTAVWTGNEMIIWGGSPLTNTGGVYNPSTDTWRPISTLNAPRTTYYHTAIWTGNRMIVWGGASGSNEGGAYDPVTDSWEPIATVNSPAPRMGHSAVWTDNEMIIWGGSFISSGLTNTGGIYSP